MFIRIVKDGAHPLHGWVTFHGEAAPPLVFILLSWDIWEKSSFSLLCSYEHAHTSPGAHVPDSL